MSAFSRLSFFLILILSSYLLRNCGEDFMTMLKEISDRNSQTASCSNWCSSPGYLITFKNEEKVHCLDKCSKFAYYPPIFNFICNVVCTPVDLLLKGRCINSELCSYYTEINQLNVRDAVEKRWFQALKRKVVETVIGK